MQSLFSGVMIYCCELHVTSITILLRLAVTEMTDKAVYIGLEKSSVILLLCNLGAPLLIY